MHAPASVCRFALVTLFATASTLTLAQAPAASTYEPQVGQ
jgi:hypothetical protein